MSVAIQASKANEAIQTIFDQNVDYVIPPYEISKSGFNILIQGKMNHILINARKFWKKIVVHKIYKRKLKTPREYNFQYIHAMPTRYTTTL